MATTQALLAGRSGRTDLATLIRAELAPYATQPLPARQGYGSELVRELVGYELGGTVELVFARQGVRCALALPISAVSL